jgi:hypothetical protein
MPAIFFHLLLVEECVLLCRSVEIANDSIYGLHGWFEFGELEKLFDKELETVRFARCVDCVSRFIRSLEEIVDLEHCRAGVCCNGINNTEVILCSLAQLFK